MLRLNRLLLASATVSLCLEMAVCAQNAPTAGGMGRMGGAPGGAPPGGFGGRGNNDMVSMTPPANVKRVKIYDATPNVVAGTDNELNPVEPTLDLYLPDTNKASGAAILLLPGGGYQMLTVPGEGATPARFFQSNNVAAFVLRYRHGPQYHYPTTLLDAQRALRFVRAHAEEYHIDPAKVGVFGGSAGGHLAALLATLYTNNLLPESPYVADATDKLSAKPAFALLLYPVIDLTDDAITHRGSRQNLTQDNKALYEALSPQKHVTRDTPPVFMVHGTNDRLVPVQNSLMFYEACLKAGVSAEMHLEENAQHGFGMAANLNDETVKEWPKQALRFLARHRWIPAE
jgi:acetyl esterase/lipase